MTKIAKISWLTTVATIALCSAIDGSNAIECPARCKCSWVLDSLEVNCAHNELIDYPNFGKTPVDHLDLSWNNFTEFPKQYASIESLVHLDLSHNQIEYIDADALRGFTNLRTLLLADNSIKSWAHIHPDEAFQNSINLKHLSLSGNKLGSFTAENSKLTLASESLVSLELKNCGIKTAGGDQLINSLPNLQRLSLSNNALMALKALPSRSLLALDLSNCKLPHFGSYMLTGLPILESLNLSWNAGLEFGNARSDVIVSDSVNSLDLSYCNLDDINLSGLPQLSALSLRGNMLREISKDTFANNTKLQNVDLSRNSLRVIDNGAFQILTGLSIVDLSYNEIARLDRSLFRFNEALVSLNLSRNIIENFTKFMSNSLRTLDLSWCQIISIEISALQSLKALQRLDLSNNLLKTFPSGMRSETLKDLRLSNCKLSVVRNETFRGFPELTVLQLNGNRFTNPFPAEIFLSNKYLEQIWIGDNPWICNCHDATFMDFYDYLMAKPQKLNDKNNVRCASPAAMYGQTWETACHAIWLTNGQTSSAGQIWTTIMCILLVMGALLFLTACVQKYLAKRKRRRNRREYRRNQEEMREIRRQNQRILEEDASPNAPTMFETNLPSYEDALLMPKLERPVKSMVDLTSNGHAARKKLQRSRTDPEENVDEGNDLLIDNRQRFRSEEMLSNRDKERTAQINPYRRTGYIEYNNSGSRRFSIEDSRFVAAHFKTQNLQSAEQIANFQSYENSPYTKRKPKIAEIPPFKRATLKADSVEFLTDPESKPGSPFAQRKPKTPIASTIDSAMNSLPMTSESMASSQAFYANNTTTTSMLPPAIEDYFGKKSHSNSSTESNFQIVVEPEVTSLPDDNNSGTTTSDSESSADLTRGKRKKRKNSTSRRASGNFAAAAAAAAANESSSSEIEPIVVVHKPMRETIF